MPRAFALLAASFALAACASSALTPAASRGDFASLKAGVDARERRGDLGNAEAAKVAGAVATWELRHAPLDEQVARVRELRACARSVSSALEERAKTHDAAGAEAAMALVEAGDRSPAWARDSLGARDDAWRAVGARGLVRDDDADAKGRARAFVDPAPAVRRAAMHAALVAADPRDVDPLAEAARLDPEAIVRSDATRALGAIGGPTAFARLRDLWSAVDEPQREDIASAYASPATRAVGGRDEIRALIASGSGPAAIEGAGAVLRSPARDAELDASAAALLARVIARASRRDRLHALAVAPFTTSGPIPDALHAAAADSDPAVRIAVLSRLASHSADRDAAIPPLEALAAPPDPAAPSPPDPTVAPRARLALAAAGDRRVQAWLEADLASADAATRLSAATGLSTLGVPARAAPLLADPDPSVRTRAACVILVGAGAR